MLRLVGIEGPQLARQPLDRPAWLSRWSVSGRPSATNIVIFVAGLQGIPTSLYEAASLDGAGPIRQFFSITLPLLSPSVFFVSVLTVIGPCRSSTWST